MLENLIVHSTGWAFGPFQSSSLTVFGNDRAENDWALFYLIRGWLILMYIFTYS